MVTRQAITAYKWAEVLSADAFSAFEESGIFDAATGARFRENILEVGGFMVGALASLSRFAAGNHVSNHCCG